MTIIIETPQPPIRERLVLVREGEPMAPRRDAEPADLERAGWVEEHLLVTARAEMRELGSERDEARCLYEAAHCERMRITDVLQRVERERDEARAALVKWQGSAEHERARCVAWLRAEAASSDWASCATWGRALSDTADRLERGEHAGTPVPALPRATDEELFAAYQTAYIVSCGVKDPSEDQRSITRVMPAERKGIAAVAARVRREQCLVTRAVEAGVSVHVQQFGAWAVTVRRGVECEREEVLVPAADVPATLARLLGEVTRG